VRAVTQREHQHGGGGVERVAGSHCGRVTALLSPLGISPIIKQTYISYIICK
jgi:hypothetical protein